MMTISGQQTAAVPISRLVDRSYLAWSTVAMAYAVAFLQRVSPQSVSLNFMTDFGTDAAGVAMLASSYFWGYTLMQIPAGLLVDRYGVKRVVLVSMAASSFGSAAFALAPNLLDVFAARLIIACGDALVFTAMLKLVAQSFSDQRFGIMSGISQVAGYVGGAMATTPLAAAVTGFGWRTCFIFIACIGIANLVIASMALRPDPASHSERTINSVLESSARALGRSANWGCAMSFASHFAVVTTLSGVWGIPMVAHVFKITPSAAGAPLLAFMGGNAIGSIFLGHIADRMAATLDTALIRICVLRMLLIAILLPPIAHAMGFVYTGVVFAALGLVAGGTVPLVLKCTKRLYTAELIGVGASVNTTAAGIFAGASQPVIALAMVAFGHSGNGALNDTTSVTDSGYGALIVILLLMSLPGIVGPLMMRRQLIDRG
jgi:predicted MFS family arabinose efflux permease